MSKKCEWCEGTGEHDAILEDESATLCDFCNGAGVLPEKQILIVTDAGEIFSVEGLPEGWTYRVKEIHP